jgi:hypothetical protein
MQQLMWRIEDSVVQLKRLMVDVVVTWNAKINLMFQMCSS